jgi:hypothetical protein|tara:strand:- start:119 stop:448 length:330 start_codon:yes stop_codon:yes gene_type:complete
MKKFIGFIIVLNALLLFGFTNMVSANDKVEATIASIIQSKINGLNVDETAVMEAELEYLAHKFAIESINIFQQYLPAILDGISADLRLKADKEFKCALLKGTQIEDDCE